MPDEWMTLEMAGRILKALGREPRLDAVHIAGGEPTLNLKLLEEVIRLAVETGVRVSYVETNASGATDPDETREAFDRLRRAGLRAVLVSVSPFHNEFVPFRNTRVCIEAAADVFGPGGAIVYTPPMHEMLSRMPDDGRHTVEEFARWAGLEEKLADIPRMYGVIPGGRAPEALRECYTPRPAEEFEGKSCLRDLTSTTHFHVDDRGLLFTGMCAGIVAATVDDFHPDMSGEQHVVFRKLCEEGPYGLMQVASRGFGYGPREDGYVSRCDLCFDVRRHLHARGKFEELRPDAFYTTVSRSEERAAGRRRRGFDETGD